MSIKKLLYREIYPSSDETEKVIPEGSTHFVLRRLADGLAVDFWSITENNSSTEDFDSDGCSIFGGVEF